MGSKLARKNKALKKISSPSVDPQLIEDVEKGLDQLDRKGEHRYRMESKEGHFVILFAFSTDHAHLRWKEFYKSVECHTCQRLQA